MSSCKDFGTCGHYRNKLDLPESMAGLAENGDVSIGDKDTERLPSSMNDFVNTASKPDVRMRFGAKRPLPQDITGQTGIDWL